MSEIGANPDDLDARAGELGALAEKIGAVRSDLAAHLARTVWLGTDAEHFHAVWRGRVSPTLQEVASFIADEARALRANAQQQRDASQGNGAGGACPVPVGVSAAASRVVSERTEKFWVGGDGGEKSLGFGVGGKADVQIVTTTYADGHVEVRLKFHGFGGAGADVKGLGVIGGLADDTTLVYRFDNSKQAEAFKHSVEQAVVPLDATAHHLGNAWDKMLDGDLGGAAGEAVGAVGGLTTAGILAGIGGTLHKYQANYQYAEHQVGQGVTAEAGADGIAGVDVTAFQGVRWKTNSDHVTLVESVELNGAVISHGAVGEVAGVGASGRVHASAEVTFDYGGIDRRNPGHAYLAGAEVHVQMQGAGSIDFLRKMGVPQEDIAYAIQAEEHGYRIDLTLKVPADQIPAGMQHLSPGQRVLPPSPEQVKQMLLHSSGSYQVSGVDSSNQSIMVAGHGDTTVEPLTGKWQSGTITGQDVVDFLSP